jgi:hypothetical protein
MNSAPTTALRQRMIQTMSIRQFGKEALLLHSGPSLKPKAATQRRLWRQSTIAIIPQRRPASACRQGRHVEKVTDKSYLAAPSRL